MRKGFYENNTVMGDKEKKAKINRKNVSFVIARSEATRQSASFVSCIGRKNLPCCIARYEP